MGQFDVYVNRQKPRNGKPFLLDIQSPMLEDLATRVVIPLLDGSSQGWAIEHLNIELNVNGHNMLLSPTEIHYVRIEDLGQKVANLAPQRQAVLSALEFLVMGI
jgi:toxin CcdB